MFPTSAMHARLHQQRNEAEAAAAASAAVSNVVSSNFLKLRNLYGGPAATTAAAAPSPAAVVAAERHFAIEQELMISRNQHRRHRLAWEEAERRVRMIELSVASELRDVVERRRSAAAMASPHHHHRSPPAMPILHGRSNYSLPQVPPFVLLKPRPVSPPHDANAFHHQVVQQKEGSAEMIRPSIRSVPFKKRSFGSDDRQEIYPGANGAVSTSSSALPASKRARIVPPSPPFSSAEATVVDGPSPAASSSSTPMPAAVKPTAVSTTAADASSSSSASNLVSEDERTPNNNNKENNIKKAAAPVRQQQRPQRRDKPKLDRNWKDMAKRLLAFLARHGHTVVPRCHDDYKLALWVVEQRKQYRLWNQGKKSNITQERIDTLNGMGFVWNAQESAWSRKFRDLKAFRTKYGHTIVPFVCEEFPGLGMWVKEQRRHHALLREKSKKGQISQERVDMLDSIGFTWDVQDALWWERYSELQSFQLETGHCMVTTKCPKNPRLGTWVHHQRRQHKLLKQGKPSCLTKERVEALDRLGFNWKPRGNTV